MPLSKEQWLNQTIMYDEWGRPPSLADVPMIYGPRKWSLEKLKHSKEEIDKMYKESIKENNNGS